jgi:general secretion pathway protein C
MAGQGMMRGRALSRPEVLPAMLLRGTELALLLLAGLLLARLGWALITPAGPFGAPRGAPPVAAIDPAALGRFDPFFRSRLQATPSAVSDLDLTLVGTRVDGASGRGSAILILPDDTQASIGVGEDVVAGVRLIGVAFDHVTLDNAGAREELYLDQSGPVSAGAIVQPSAPPTAVRPRLGADLQAIPRITNGLMTGLVLSPKGSGTAFAAAGLQAGDVLVSVDGTPAASLGDPAALVRRLDAGGLAVQIERGGRTLSLTLDAGGVQR